MEKSQRNATNAMRTPHVHMFNHNSHFGNSKILILRRRLKTHTGEKPNKCNQCDFASCYSSALRTHLKTHSGEKSKKCNQCDFASFRASWGLEDTFVNAQWSKVKQMQPMWLWLFSGKQFKDTLENAQWRKVKLQQMWLCFLWDWHFENKFDKTHK